MLQMKSKERSRLGPYEVISKIGEGGMGTVYLTKMDGPAGFNKLAVVKELRAELTGSRPLVDMFLNEARLAARLTHPNVVHTYGASEEGGSLYLSMEYLDGQPWSRIRRALWKAGTLPFGLHTKVLAEVLAGLHYAHELHDYDGTALRIVHCDVSPQNVFVTYDGQVKIVDFGIACAVDDGRKTNPKMMVGKLGYLAPEQARGEPLDRRADVFAVGVMLWELMAGKRFAAGNDQRLLRERRVDGAEPRIREVVPSAPPKLAEICDRALSLDPNDRFATAGEFREALLQYLAEDMQDIDHAQLGELVVNAFQDERSRVHRSIERHLSGSGVRSNPALVLVDALQIEPVEHTLRADLSELASVSRLNDDAALRSASTSAGMRFGARLARNPTWAGIGGALLLLGLWLGSRPPPMDVTKSSTQLAPAKQPPSAAGPAAAIPITSPPVVPHAVPEPSQIQLTLSASPVDVSFSLDGVPLRGNPHIQRRAADGELHLLRAVGSGLQSQERVIMFDRDRDVTFKLSRAALASTRSTGRYVRRSGSDSSSSGSGGTAFGGSPSASSSRGRADVPYDAALTPRKGSRAIYDQDPYR
jgi:serine/threonine-protein kinase